MQYLVYRSRALVSPDRVECREIVERSVVNNARIGITGFLHAEEGLFVQYIEGPSDSLWSLYDRIRCDRRHADPVLLGEGVVRTRRFSDWRLGLSRADVMRFGDFLEEISSGWRGEQPTGRNTIAFLMAASQRIDLGLYDPS